MSVATALSWRKGRQFPALIKLKKMEISGNNSKCNKVDFDRNNNSNNSDNGRSGDKYGLRPRTAIKRLHQDLPLPEVSKRTGRSKSRPAPLSKYRRKTANARERHRMRAINTAFESLRKVLPDALEVDSHSSTMTKITTLRLAVDYIQALTDVLGDDEESSFGHQSREGRTIYRSNLCNTSNSSLNSQHPSNVMVTSFAVPVSLGQQGERSSASLSLHLKDSSAARTSSSQLTSLGSFGSSSSPMLASSSPSVSRGSLGSTSDLEDLLSDDSGLLEDNLDVFHDIPTISFQDPLEVLLGNEKDVMEFSPEL
ncbi:hypothetical protein SK128_018543 [Halocaridina rubra]|uniref:BHLH domain-containing protein n=1 Tax=Halocaridina rubra TaxID=373956 RepID=A0AAN9AB51_HALRR